MDWIRITKVFYFETAHALFGYDGKCKNIHGHSYKLFITVKGNPNEDTESSKLGMVMDFGDLKKIVEREVVNVFDHAVLLNENSPHKKLGEKLLEEGQKVVFTPYQPSCENMILHIVKKVKSQLPENIKLVSVRLHETENSYGEWLAEDNK